MNPLRFDLLLFAGIILAIGFLATLVFVYRRARYERFRKRYERLHPLGAANDGLTSRLVDGIVAKNHTLEVNKILANISDDQSYQLYTQSLVVAIIIWVFLVAILAVLLGLNSTLLILFVLVTPAIAFILARPLFTSTIATRANKVRAMIAPSLPNLLRMMRLEIAAGNDPVIALGNIVSDYAPFISPAGLRLLNSWLSQAQNQPLGDVLIQEGEYFDLPDVTMLGKDFQLSASGMPLSDILDKMVASTSELSYIAFLKAIKRRAGALQLLVMPVFATILVISVTSVIVLAGGLHTFSSLL